jgi:uncharacterized membrane protein
MAVQTFRFRTYLFTRIFPMFLILIWCTAIFSSFLNPVSKSISFLSLMFLKMFSSVCHQDPDKSILLGQHIYVCARCAGIYAGSFLSALMLIFGFNYKIRSVKLLSISSIILFVDVLLVNIGLYRYSHTISFITGLFFGLVAYQFFIQTIEHLLQTDF